MFMRGGSTYSAVNDNDVKFDKDSPLGKLEE